MKSIFNCFRIFFWLKMFLSHGQIMSKVYRFRTKFLPVPDDRTWLWGTLPVRVCPCHSSAIFFDSNKVVTLLWDEQTLSANLNNIFPRDSLLHNLHIFILWYVSSLPQRFSVPGFALYLGQECINLSFKEKARSHPYIINLSQIE